MTTYIKLIIRSFVCVYLTVSLVFTMVSCEDLDRLTYDIADYNTEDYPMCVPFPKTIPENAEVVKFVSYDYYYEDWEDYLELRFDDADAFDAFLDGTFEYAEESYRASMASNYSGEWMTMQPNPYDSNFIDCFYWDRWVSIGDNYYTGYEIEWCNNEGLDYCCHYCIISYSLIDLTVIITTAGGTFHYSTNKKPEYYVRFGVPTEPVSRMILIRSQGD